jgi:two-component system NtrC family sensor kinase
MLFPGRASGEPETTERPFGAVDLLQIVLESIRGALDFELAVAVLCEDERHVVPIYAAGSLSPGVVEGVSVQALAAFVELAGPQHAAWPSDEPVVRPLGKGAGRAIAEPESYEDAPLVVGGAVAGMLRIAPVKPLSREQRSSYFALAADLSKAIERLDAQRSQTRMVQERLLQSEKMSSVGQLVSGVAHELNNPLTGIMGFAQLLLLRKDIDEAAHKQIETIYAEADRASKIVSNLLTFARRRKPQKEPSDINTLIERVLELRNYDLRVRNIDVQMDLEPELPQTMADANQLQQVFLNIVINAEQAMRTDVGEGVLRIATRTDGQSVLVSFRDSGPGMSAETVRRIFDPFFTTKDAGEGTGLGLTISYGIIEEHGGRIWADSERGKGTTFHIELPIVVGAAAQPSENNHDAPAARQAAGERRRILVVDDEENIQKLLTGVLEMDGHDVLHANNGKEALDRLRAEPFDLIISDIKMPVMGGPELYKTLHDAGNPLARRIIFITGDTVAPDTRQFLQGIDNAVVAKPFRLRDIRESVAAALSL